MSQSSEPVRFVPMSDVRSVLLKRAVYIDGRIIESLDDIRGLSPEGMHHLTRAVESAMRQEVNG
jgi:hypothetical protein